MAQQDPQVGRVVDQLPRLRRRLPVGARVDTDELDAPPAHLDRLALVDEQVRRCKVGQAALRARKDRGCARRRGFRARRTRVPSRRSSARSVGSPRGRETRSPVTTTSSGSRSPHPLDRPLDRARPARGQPEVEVRQVRDAQLRRAHAAGAATRRRACAAAPSPPRTSPSPARRPRRREQGSGTRPRGAAQTSSFSSTGVDRHDVPLELQLGLLEPGGDTDELREVEDRHLEVLARRRLQLRLPRVEREVAERARRHDHVGAGFLGLLDRLDQLAECRLLARLDDREAAALDLRRIVDRLAAARLDDPLERPGPVGILEAEDLRGAQDLAAVERRDLQALEPLVRRLLQQLVAVALRDLPEQVPHLDVAAVRRDADALQVLADALAQRVVVLQLPVRLPEIQRADVADRQQRVAAGRLRVREDPRVQVQVVVRLGLVDVAGTAARDGLQLDELEARPSARAPASRSRAPSRTATRGSPCSTRRASSFCVRRLHAGLDLGGVLARTRLFGELDAAERVLALHDAERAVAALLLDEVVERARLADSFRDVRRERRRHLAASSRGRARTSSA